MDAIDQVPPQRRVVHDIPGLLEALDLLSGRAPDFCADPDRANFFPASTLFVHMMATPAGQSLFRNQAFNDAVRAILKRWCDFLDSPASQVVLHTGDDGWLSSASYRRHDLDEYIIPDKAAPHWGFTSFNDFFHRGATTSRHPGFGAR